MTSMDDSFEGVQAVATSFLGEMESMVVLVIVLYFIVAGSLLFLERQCLKASRCKSSASGVNRMSCKVKLTIWMKRVGILDAIDFGQTAMTLILCVIYVAETYGVQTEHFRIVEHVFNAVFILDYCLRLYLSRDRFSHLFSLFSMIDVVTVVPWLLSWSYKHANATIVLRTVRLSKLFYVLRSFRLLRLAPGDGVKREVFLLGFTVAALIFIAAGFYQVVENGLDFELGAPMKIAFHECLYWTTIEVLGRPRLTPSGALGNLFLVLLVAASIIMIPKQLATLWQVLQRDPYARRVASKKKNDNHIVVMGHIDFPAINLLLYEVYHEDRAPVTPIDVVILSKTPPDRDVQGLLTHPSYISSVTYLQGSPQADSDLKRARVDEADAVVIVVNKYPVDPAWEDAQVAAVALTCKAYKNAMLHKADSKTEPTRRRLRVLAQVLSAETRDRLQMMPGWDVRYDMCLVIGELSAAMLALASLHRGLATLVLNLVSHTTRNDSADNEEWFHEYQRGSEQEIYHCSVTGESALVGMTLFEGARWMLQAHGILLVAKKTPKEGISEGRGGHRNNIGEGRGTTEHLVVFPGDEVPLAANDRVFGIARSVTHLVSVVKRSTKDVQTEHVVQTEAQGSGGAWRRIARGTRSRSSTLSSSATPHLCRNPSSGNFTIEFEEESSALELLTLSESAAKQAVDWGRKIARNVSRSRPGLPSGQVQASPPDAAPESEAQCTVPSESSSAPVEPERTADLESLFRQQYESDPVKLLSDVEELLERTEVERGSGNGSRKSTKTVRWVSDMGEEEGLERSVTVDSILKLQSRGEHLSWLKDHILIFGGEPLLLAMIVKMLHWHSPSVEVVLVGKEPDKKLEHSAWEGIDCEHVHFVKASAQRPSDLAAVNLTASRAVIVVPDSQSGRLGNWGAPKDFLDGLEQRRVIDSDTILTTNILATRDVLPMYFSRDGEGCEVCDVWTVTQLVQEGSLGRFFGMAPEAHGGSSDFDYRWQALAPLNVAPLFAAGHIVSATTLDRFLVESYYNPHTLILIERLFGLAGLFVDPWWAQTGDYSTSRPYTFQISLTKRILEHCETYGDLSNMLLDSRPEPLLAMGLFRHPQGRRSSYSLLVSLEAAEELDFRSQYYGVDKNSTRDGDSSRRRADSTNAPFMGAASFILDESTFPASRPRVPTHRLPYVITNPPKDMKLYETDLVFVLGRCQQYQERSENLRGYRRDDMAGSAPGDKTDGDEAVRRESHGHKQTSMRRQADAQGDDHQRQRDASRVAEEDQGDDHQAGREDSRVSGGDRFMICEAESWGQRNSSRLAEDRAGDSHPTEAPAFEKRPARVAL